MIITNPFELLTSYLHSERTSQEAINEFYPYHTHYFEQLGRSRGRLIQLSRSDYEQNASLEGAYFVGSPQQIIDKLLCQHEVFGHQRFLAQIDLGGLPYKKVAQTIELLAQKLRQLSAARLLMDKPNKHRTNGSIAKGQF